MKIETILDAMVMAHQSLSMNMLPKKAYRRGRQSFVFRARILRMNAENIEQLEDCRKEIIEKDEEIRVLEKYIKDHDYKTILDYMEKYLEGDME